MQMKRSADEQKTKNEPDVKSYNQMNKIKLLYKRYERTTILYEWINR